MALLEAMMVRATQVQGVKEVIENGIQGFLVPLESPEELSKAILQLLSAPDQCRIIPNHAGIHNRPNMRKIFEGHNKAALINFLCKEFLMKNILSEAKFLKMFASLLIAAVFYGSCFEFYNIAWGTGVAFGEFSLKWGVIFYSFVFFCVALFLGVNFLIWQRGRFSLISTKLVLVRERIKFLRGPLAALALFFPLYFFQYTVWGVIFQGLYIRIAVWAAVIFIFAGLVTSGSSLIGWKEFLAALILTASGFSIGASLTRVTGYPFSLGWSEGNRLWDYSVLFGRQLYDYPADKGIPVLLDFGRRFIGGLPFLFPGITIGAERLWVGLTLIIPYILLGLAIFRKLAKEKKLWLMTTLWTFLFLKQGPIHPPLVISAALVALAWGGSLWYAIPIMIGAGYFAQASRFTWLFAPGIWIFMLEFSSISFTSLAEHKPSSAIWKRAVILGACGIFGGFMLSNLLASARALVSPHVETIITPVATVVTQSPVITNTPSPAVTAAQGSIPAFIDQVVQIVTIQPLLWYRLLPNSTYGNGILLALLFATAPLLVVLIYLLANKLWSLNRLQKLVLIMPSLAFFAVGLVASTKIGGGGDLHNMDMFLICLLFTSAIAWYNGGGMWIQDGSAVSTWMKFVVALMIIIPAFAPLREIRSYSFGEDVSWLVTLTDSPNEKSLEMLPSKDTIDSALKIIQDQVALAQKQGDVLFLDQRQLLTFGYITNVPLIPEYEKKVLMNEALSSNGAYFESFYSDIAAHRFTLIISEPLRTPIKDSSFQFGEENNAWVEWVANPLLCYYEPKITLKEVNVQLLVPKTEPVDCSIQFP